MPPWRDGYHLQGVSLFYNIMIFLEKDLEQIIFETDNELLQDKELYISGKKLRQLRIGNYGIADLVTFEKSGYYPKCENGGGFYVENIKITIYELKQNKINLSSFMQAIRYAKGIKRYLENRNFYHNYELYICLIGKEIDLNADFVYLSDIINNLSLITYSYDFDGISFKNHYNYKLTNEGF